MATAGAKGAKLIALDVGYATGASAGCPGSSRWCLYWLRRAGNVSFAGGLPGRRESEAAYALVAEGEETIPFGRASITGFSPLVPAVAPRPVFPKVLYFREFDQEMT